MTTGREFTKKIKDLLAEADQSGRYLYLKSLIPDGNPLRIIRCKTERGMAIATTMNGGTVPVSALNIDRFYIN